VATAAIVPIGGRISPDMIASPRDNVVQGSMAMRPIVGVLRTFFETARKFYPVSGLAVSIYESAAFAALMLMIGVVPHHPHRANRRQQFTPLQVSRLFQFLQLLVLLLSHADGLLFLPMKLEW
jgi:hypothetical protein